MTGPEELIADALQAIVAEGASRQESFCRSLLAETVIPGG
jgi:hypothetical protein